MMMKTDLPKSQLLKQCYYIITSLFICLLCFNEMILYRLLWNCSYVLSIVHIKVYVILYPKKSLLFPRDKICMKQSIKPFLFIKIQTFLSACVECLCNKNNKKLRISTVRRPLESVDNLILEELTWPGIKPATDLMPGQFKIFVCINKT